jgi:aspartate/methionine/tyrosine aminotransferase
MKRAAAEALDTKSNQYPPMLGVPELRTAVAEHAARHTGQRVSAEAGEVLVTSGATEGIAAALMGLCNRGDRVVAFEPLYDAYAGVALAAGVELVAVRLRPPRWALPPPPPPPGDDEEGGGGGGDDDDDDEAAALRAAEAEAEAAAAAAAADGDGGDAGELGRAFFPGGGRPPAKLAIVNTPHNPTGKVFSRRELARLAAFVRRAGCLALLDEVYEHLVHPPPPPEGDAAGAASARPPRGHVSLASLPGMSPRCVRLGSAGKTFSFTGWKVGWATGPAALLAPMIKAHQFLTFTVPPAMQHGVAHGLTACRAFYEGMGADLARSRRALAPRLEALGFRVLPAQGTYFLVADAAAFVAPGEDDAAFCRRLAAEGGVALIPVSAFYLPPPPAADGRAPPPPPPPPRTLVRFAFCKSAPVLDEAVARLERYLGRPGAPGPGAKGDGAVAAAAAAAASSRGD